MPEQFYDRDFPDLRVLGYERTSEPHWHNCIAYAAGDFERKWWPDDFPPNSGCYWPLTVTDRSSTLEGFIEAFRTLGSERCGDGSWEPDFEKVAFYSIRGEVQHAAKQQSDGTWRSKLNEGEDIRHTLAGLEGPC